MRWVVCGLWLGKGVRNGGGRRFGRWVAAKIHGNCLNRGSLRQRDFGPSQRACTTKSTLLHMHSTSSHSSPAQKYKQSTVKCTDSRRADSIRISGNSAHPVELSLTSDAAGCLLLYRSISLRSAKIDRPTMSRSSVATWLTVPQSLGIA